MTTQNLKHRQKEHYLVYYSEIGKGFWKATSVYGTEEDVRKIVQEEFEENIDVISYYVYIRIEI